MFTLFRKNAADSYPCLLPPLFDTGFPSISDYVKHIPSPHQGKKKKKGQFSPRAAGSKVQIRVTDGVLEEC